LLSILLAYEISSVIEIWYTLGSLCIPAIILAVVSSYYPKFRIKNEIMIIEMIVAVTFSTSWYFLREGRLITGIFYEIEPMIVGLFTGGLIHLFGILKEK
jgi:SSS family solute:Na+ symporter